MRYRFHGCDLDTTTHEFRTGGDVQRLEPQVFDLLHCLVENAGRLVSRDELIEQVWNGRIVSEATISARINAVRKAVGDDGTRQAVIQTVPRRGFRLIAEVQTTDDREAPAALTDETAATRQTVRFCSAPDGTRIAFAVSGEGPPLMRAGHWLTHLEHDWHSPIWRPLLDELGKSFTVIRYDQRGNGLSDRDFERDTLDAFADDLAAVADAAGLDRFPIYATSQGVPTAIEFAARHPGRVARLVLHGGYHKGRLLREPADREQAEAYMSLMRHGWGAEGSQFLQAFASLYIPDGTPEQIASLVELQKITTTPETAVRLRRAFDSFEVTDRLAEMTVPTLVIHARNDAIHPLQQGIEMAAMIPNAELEVLETRNHNIPPHDPAWGPFFEAVRRFLGVDDVPFRNR
jgi:DNA-binding winged helix-turn-helix (wHTH) protein/alpha-beta hydrolase superfamily lysophospholipase